MDALKTLEETANKHEHRTASIPFHRNLDLVIDAMNTHAKQELRKYMKFYHDSLFVLPLKEDEADRILEHYLNNA